MVRGLRANRISMAVTDSFHEQGSRVLSQRRPLAHSRQVRGIHRASHAALAQVLRDRQFLGGYGGTFSVAMRQLSYLFGHYSSRTRAVAGCRLLRQSL